MKAVFNKVWNWIGGISADRCKHFIAGLLVAAITAIVLPQIASFAFVIAFVAGLIKEVVDEAISNTFDEKDLISTVLGGVVMQIIVWLL